MNIGKIYRINEGSIVLVEDSKTEHCAFYKVLYVAAESRKKIQYALHNGKYVKLSTVSSYCRPTWDTCPEPFNMDKVLECIYAGYDNEKQWNTWYPNNKLIRAGYDRFCKAYEQVLSTVWLIPTYRTGGGIPSTDAEYGVAKPMYELVGGHDIDDMGIVPLASEIDIPEKCWQCEYYLSKAYVQEARASGQCDDCDL